MTRTSAWFSAALVAFTAVLLVTRILLLSTSYDTNHNWEEPVFLFSAAALQDEGVGQVFAYQDDLNHGGSVVLLLLAVPWVSLFGTSLVVLKGIAVLWSALTLCALMVVARRYFSTAAAVLLGAFYVALSPTLARINVTLVGSHPEALLPCTVALGLTLESLARRRRGERQSLALLGSAGLASGLAIWVAYVSVMFIVPLLAVQTWLLRSRRAAVAVAGGMLVGFAPWLYQNCWLRPHGAFLWMQHLARADGAGPHSDASVLNALARSFGYPPAVGGVILLLCAVAFVLLWIALFWPSWRERLPWHPEAMLPLLLAPVVGLGLLVAALLPQYRNEGYYHYRFFVPMQVSLFWTLALATDILAAWVGRLALWIAALVTLLVGVWGQTPLFGQGNHYHADYQRDRLRGCNVFGVAEGARAADATSAIARLKRLPADGCRNRAFGGFGWTIAARYLKEGDLGRVQSVLVGIGEPAMAWAACGGFFFIMSHSSDDRVDPTQRAEAVSRVSALCRTFRP